MALPIRWGLQIDESILKALRKIHKRDRIAILEVIRLLPINPYFGDIEKMKGEEDVWRRRVRAYRIFYKIVSSRNIILVFHLERRTTNTYR